ncbi:MAG: hypothetical protein UR94_C0004G0025 [Parcubacteria group bacterium GW2011_GWA2_36_10]|nr:MAG: hypothetical protein UR94_C0004G0025 [Parcubacteria group bacterium GW2011_GWA2_36_10]
MKTNRRIKVDKIIMFLWPIIAAIVSLVIQANFFISMLLFLALPALYLSYRNKKMVKKMLLFSLPALLIVIVIDYICEITGTWLVMNSIFDYRILGFVTIDIIIWFFIYTYLIIAYYEYFLEHKFKDVLYKPRLKYLYLYFLSVLVTFFVVFFTNKAWLHIRYFYLLFGTVMAIIPITLVFNKFPNIITKFVKTGVYFFYLAIIYELTAITLNQWMFPGKDFIGIVTLFNISFPFEELFFWMLLGAMSILSYYEFFDDDKK